MLPLVQDLDSITWPDFENDGHHIYLNSRYTQVQGSMHWYSMMASRGCPYRCEFCVNPVQRQVYKGLGNFLRRRTVASVIAELQEVTRRNPELRKIYFYDEVFTTDHQWVSEFAEAYRQEIGLPFFCQTDPRINNERVIPHLARAGVKWLSMGIQGSPEVAREYYDRPYKVEDILCVARLGKQYGFDNIFDLIIDDPFSADSDRREVLELLLSIPRPYVLNTYSLLYFPGYLTTRRALEGEIIHPDQVEGAKEERFNWNRFMQQGKNPKTLFWECLYDLAANTDYPRAEIRRLAEDALLREEPFEFVEACLRARGSKRITYIPESELRMVEHGNTAMEVAHG
ncbi:MAG: radical SAM protein [Acidobacteria bacterium]|nr:radical SAM protein [Acidobacteriota bacterium]